MTTELKEIERLTMLNNGRESFHSWGSDVRTSLYHFLINEFREKKYNFFSGEHGDYLVYFEHGEHGRGGMDMGTPDTMNVVKVNEYNKD